MISCLLFAVLTLGAGSPLQTQLSPAKSASLPKGGTVANLPLSTRTQVPGNDLKADRYSITVLATLTDRVVLVIMSDSRKVESEFLAVPSTRAQNGASLPGPVFMKSKTKDALALQGFRFPDGTSVDVVYPKDEAVQLATANKSTVLAIDPPSEGKPSVSNMSAEAKQLITLWQLSPVAVGPKNTPGIEAKRYDPPSNTIQASTAASSQPVSPSHSPVIASNVVPPSPAAPRAHVVKELPHTASQQPLMLLIGALCFGLAGVLALRRLSA